MLQRWNTKINLVGRQDIANLWSRHIEDALFLYRCLPPLRSAPWLLDVGTGGGLPGMVLGIVDPKRNVVLVDRSERKVRFLNQVVAELKLSNVYVLCADFSAELPVPAGAPPLPRQYPVICARAVAPPEILWHQTEHLLAPKGELLVACGPQTREQLPLNVDVEWWPDTGAAHKDSSVQRGAVRLTRTAD